MGKLIIFFSFSYFFLIHKAVSQTGLPANWDKAAVIIEKYVIDSLGAYTSPHGTGFFVDDDSLSFGSLLVTNRHLLEKRDSILIRFYTTTGLAQKVVYLRDKFGRQTWKHHPDPTVDIAVVSIGSRLEPKKYVYSIKYSMFRNSSELEVGEDVFFFGFPLGVTELRDQIPTPILRHGVVSYKTSEVTKIGYEFIPKSVILVDGFSFGGNSGSPVLTKGTLFKPKAGFVGIIFSHVRDFQRFIIDSGVVLKNMGVLAETLKVELNTGLAKAFSAEKVKETVELFRPTK